MIFYQEVAAEALPARGLNISDTIAYNIYRRRGLPIAYKNMPKKIRELKAMLRKAGFYSRPGKGSHTVWFHPAIPDTLPLSGNDGDDAKAYQEKKVRNIIRKLKEVQE